MLDYLKGIKIWRAGVVGDSWEGWGKEFCRSVGGDGTKVAGSLWIEERLLKETGISEWVTHGGDEIQEEHRSFFFCCDELPDEHDVKSISKRKSLQKQEICRRTNSSHVLFTVGGAGRAHCYCLSHRMRVTFFTNITLKGSVHTFYRKIFLHTHPYENLDMQNEQRNLSVLQNQDDSPVYVLYRCSMAKIKAGKRKKWAWLLSFDVKSTASLTEQITA